MRIALTFDDGPNTTTTAQILAELERFGVPASFFVIGQNITEQSAPMMVQALRQGCTVECHSWSHPAFPELSAEQMVQEVERTNALVTRCTGAAPQFFRPPYIALNDVMFSTINMPFIQGRGVDDWKVEIPAETKARNVVQHAEDGQIVLLHDSAGNDTTVAAVRLLIPALLERGCTFYTVRGLFAACNVAPVTGRGIWTNVLHGADTP